MPRPNLCADCIVDRMRWLDSAPATLGVGIVSHSAYDRTELGVRENRAARYERWRALVRQQMDAIATTCRTQHAPRRPRLLDLFCGEGGSSAGYVAAGFEVVGVDIEPQPAYPFEFHQADAMTFDLDGFDAIHASPPCTGHTTMANIAGFRGEHGTEWMLRATIDRLAAAGLPYVVENVVGADMPTALTLCGSEFNLTDGPYLLRRHRRFAANVFLWSAGGCRCAGRDIVGVYGELSKNDRPASGERRVMRAGVERARRVMRMPWASPEGITQAIPPAYTEFIGDQLLDILARGLHVPKEVTQ